MSLEELKLVATIGIMAFVTLVLAILWTAK